MSTTTPYLGLVLYDSTTDQAVTFATFRAVWGGPASTSNFYKIDTGMSGFNTRITNLENASGAVPVPALFSSANFYVATGVTGVTSYTVGDLIILSLDTTSDGTVTLNINSLGTKSVMKVDSAGTAINLTGSDLVKNRQYLFMYDGTRWTWVSANSADQIQIVGTSGNVVTVGSTNNLLGTTTQSGLIADTIHAATSKTTPVDADEIGLIDSAESNVLKKLTFSNTKAALKTYFDPLYTSGIILGGRLTLTSGTPVTTADVTGAVSIYYTPYFHNMMQLWDGTLWQGVVFTEKTLALGTVTSGLPYDVFGYLSAGELVLEKLAWTNGATRATGISLQDGRYCKTGDKTRLYLGTFYTTSTTQTEDSKTKRYLWNKYNRARKNFYQNDATASWTYAVATIRQARATGTNKVEFIVGLVEDDVSATYSVIGKVGTAGGFEIGVGLNTTTAFSSVSGYGEQTSYTQLRALLETYPTLGYNYLSANELGNTNTVTFAGGIYYSLNGNIWV